MQLTHAVLPGMLSRRRGSVVTVSSIAGTMALPFDPAYVATKYGVAAFMRSLATEQGNCGVTFSTIFPGAIRSAGMAADVESGIPTRLVPFVTRSP